MCVKATPARRALTALLVVAFVLVGCGNGSDDSDLGITLLDPDDVLAGLGDAMSDARTFRMEGTATDTFDDPPDPVIAGPVVMVAKLDMAVDLDADAAHVVRVTDLGSSGPYNAVESELLQVDGRMFAGIEATAQMMCAGCDVDAGPPDGPEGVEGSVPVRLPDVPTGVRWVEMSDWEKESLSDEFGVFFEGGDIIGFVDSFGDLTGEIEIVGESPVRGVDTVQYRFVVDPEHRSLPAQVNLWVDGDGRPRRITTETIDAERQSTFSVEVEIFDFGANVGIEAPGDDEVITFDELMELWGDPVLAECFDVKAMIDEQNPEPERGPPCIRKRYDQDEVKAVRETVDDSTVRSGHP